MVPHEALVAQARSHQRAGDWRRAARLCEQVLSQSPTFAPALHLMAQLAAGRRQAAVAMDFARRAVSADPGTVAYRITLGTFLLMAGHAAEAADVLRAAATLAPDSFDAWANLGAALGTLNRSEEAAAAMDRAIELAPDREEGYANRAQLSRRGGRLTEAVGILEAAIARGVTGPRVYNNLGSALRLLGRVDDAVAAFESAVEREPMFPVAWDNYLYSLLFHSGSDSARVAAAQRRWAALFTEPLRDAHRPHDNDPSPDRRLRIGYVSPNFRAHPVGLFMGPILAGHDRTQVEVFCYSDVASEDAMTASLHASADVWRVTRGVDDASLARLVREDRIDVLVDLNQHMGGSRLLAFARKPAPVQVCYLGYAAGTGLRAIDYRLTDPHLDPPGVASPADVEELVRLPETYWCYRPSTDAPDVEAEPPVVRNGFPTFGSFNAAAKVNPQVVAVWAELLRAVPRSRLLMMLSGLDESDPHWRVLFAEAGIAPDRIRFVGFRPYGEYLRTYGEVDVALDPFPYNGGTTTLDGLWMGVPTVTLAGRSGVSRAGVSVLTNAGLADLIASTPQAYVAIAARLAADVPRLRGLRAGLRDRLRASSLMSEPRFVKDLEDAYRTMWRQWCQRALRTP